MAKNLLGTLERSPSLVLLSRAASALDDRRRPIELVDALMLATKSAGSRCSAELRSLAILGGTVSPSNTYF